MTEHAAEHPPTKAMLYIGAFVGIWLVLIFIILSKFGIHQGWPAFMTLPLFFISGADPKQLPNVFVGGVIGLLITAAVAPAATFLMMNLGKAKVAAIMAAVPPEQIAETLGKLGALYALPIIFLIVFLMVGLSSALPMFFNNYALVYFTIAVVFPTEVINENLIPWLGTLIVGGGVFSFGTLLFVQKVLPKLMMPKASAEATKHV